MTKSVFAFTSFLLALVLACAAAPAAARPVALWHAGPEAVSSMLPDDWRKMTPEEWAAILQDNKTMIPAQSGTLVAGFSPVVKENDKNSSYILVLAKIGKRVTEEMIQKTFVWLQKNNELVTGMLPAEVKGMQIENIEYRQDRPAIFFQTRLDMNDTVIVGVSAIFFLNNGYLNVVCLTDQGKFADHKGIFHSFINRLSIPAALRYTAGPAASPTASAAARYRAWLLANAKPLLGAAMLVGIYVLAFRLGRKKRLQG